MGTTTDDLDILTRTLYGEADARNEADAYAIGCVVMNRTRHKLWPDDVSEVCLQPWQFSCWNPGDPGRERITKVKANDPWFLKCREIARSLIAGGEDVTNGATHYYATYIPKPKWAKGKRACYEVHHRRSGSHLFFNDIDTPAPKTAREALEQKRPIGQTGTIKAARTGVVATTGIGLGAEVVRDYAPTIPLMQTALEYAPWVIVVVLLSVVLYMAWRRIEDRKAGYR